MNRASRRPVVMACNINVKGGRLTMSGKRMLTISIFAGVFAVVGGWAVSAQDKYTLKVPNGLAFSEFRGYEGWQVVSVSHGTRLAVILGNPAMIDAYKAGIP